MSEDHKPTREEALIRSIVNAEFAYKGDSKKEKPTPPVIAIYREHGAGGGYIARRLAKILNLHIYDQEILDRVADAAKVDKEQMAELDDKVKQDKSHWVRGMFTTNTAYPASYRRHLVDVVLDIAEKGGIIMGRAGHIILADRNAVRVRILGNEERCAERIAERDKLTLAAAREKAEKVNEERSQFLWKMFHIRHNDPITFDLTINTDHFENLDVVSDLIMIAMISMGFDIPEPPEA